MIGASLKETVDIWQWSPNVNSRDSMFGMFPEIWLVYITINWLLIVLRVCNTFIVNTACKIFMII